MTSGEPGQDETLVASGAAPVFERLQEPSRGTAVGRYVVLSRLGAGAMGVVYAAYDPELDRKVALKLLRERQNTAKESDAHRRLLREAQALARLSHPNVVAVHDVGEHEGRVFVAMEFVDGQTLGRWLRTESRPWPEVVDVMVRAGRGLAAAHFRGLVHRDFKPDNVMIGDDGRVRVMDFGLARADTKLPTKQPRDTDDSAAAPRYDALEVELTQRGTMIGTPVYMAPEQLGGKETGPAADQFSFCVALWEALFGVRPFRGETFVELAAKIFAGELASPPSGSKVPMWLRRIVYRGLEVDLERRWPGMDALLDALTRGQRRARIRMFGLGITAVGLVAAAVFAAHHLDVQRSTEACEAAGESITEVWNDEVRARVRHGLLQAKVSYAAVTADKVMPLLDAQALAWRGARTETCLDGGIRETWDADLLDRSLWCLDDRRMELEALLAELGRGEARTVQMAVRAAASLTHLAPCRNPDLLERLPAPPVQRRDEVRTVRAELSRAAALQRTGAYDEGLAVATSALEAAEALQWLPLHASSRYQVGTLSERTGDYVEAEAMLEAAYFEAAQAGAVEVASDTVNMLVYTVGYRLSRHADGLRWSRHSEVVRVALPDPGGLRGARSLNSLAAVHRATGAYAEAKALHQRALDIYEQALGPDHPDVAQILNNLAGIHEDIGAYAQAEALHQRALDTRKQALGPDHPDVAESLSSLANVHWATGAYAEAKALHQRALDIREQALGPDHPDVAVSLNSLAAVQQATGAYTEAEALHQRALNIREQALGPNHPDVAMTLNNLAEVHRATGAYAEARALHERSLQVREQAFEPDHPTIAASLTNLAAVHSATGAHGEAKERIERALDIWEQSLGPDHPHVATSLTSLADVHRATGSYGEAKALYQRALDIWEQSLGLNHPHLAYPLVGLAEVALAQRGPKKAVSLAERAVGLRVAGHAPLAEVAAARFALARALHDSGMDRVRAMELAERARQDYAETGDAGVDAMVDEVNRWLAKHGGRP